MKNLTETFTINNAWVNLWAQAKTDGWDGPPMVGSLTVVNPNETAAYLHFTSNGATNPTTAADGLPLSNSTDNAPNQALTQDHVDLATTWIHSAGNQSIKYSITGI